MYRNVSGQLRIVSDDKSMTRLIRPARPQDLQEQGTEHRAGLRPDQTQPRHPKHLPTRPQGRGQRMEAHLCHPHLLKAYRLKGHRRGGHRVDGDG
jgi:hypothetical protein